MDTYLKALIQTHVHIDPGGRAFFKGEPLEVHLNGSVKKVLIPGMKHLLTFDELKRLGARVEVQTLFSLAIAGGEGRWKDEIQERRRQGIPSNVYVANARTIQRALAENKTPPPVKWLGRQGRECTEVRDTIDEVLDDMRNNRWRNSFRRGSRKAR